MRAIVERSLTGINELKSTEEDNLSSIVFICVLIEHVEHTPTQTATTVQMQSGSYLNIIFSRKKTPPDLVCEVKSRTVFLPLNGAKERERAVARRGIGIWCTRAKNTKPLSCRKSFAEILPRQ